jgi:hypothetical protein
LAGIRRVSQAFYQYILSSIACIPETSYCPFGCDLFKTYIHISFGKAGPWIKTKE